MMQRSLLSVVVVSMLALAGCGGSGGDSTNGSSSAPTVSAGAKASGNLTVWVDAGRLPAAKAYIKEHPDVKVNLVTFDGDGNGATTMQTKIQLWNRTNKGWPDVIFSEQVNDPIWMAKKPFEFAAPLDGLISKDLTSKWPAASTAQCTVDGKQYCLQDNIAPAVTWYNKKLMDKFGYTVPKTWQEWAALGQKVATEHPGYIVGNIGDSYGHWIYLWGNQCPLETLKGNNLTINSADEHCTRVTKMLDPLIKNKTVPPLSVFTPDFAKTYGGKDPKILVMPGPNWYAQALFDQTLHIPAGQITAAPPLQWESEPVTTGQVGGGPWIISRHSTNLPAAADFVTWVTTVFNPPSGTDIRPGYPAYAPLATKWLEIQAKNPYFAADPTPALKDSADKVWQGWNLVTYPDQPVWSNTVVTKLVAGQDLTSLMQPFGDALAQAAQASGYEVARN